MSRRAPPAADISKEPLICAVHMRWFEMLLGAYALLLAYTCMVPFDFVEPSEQQRTIAGLHVDGAHVPDVLANIALYVPIGALGFAVLRRAGLGGLPAMGGAILLAAGESLAIEQAQRFVGTRFASWVDVTANVLGGALGAAIVVLCHGEIRRLLSRAQSAAGQHWYSAVAKAMVCLLLVLHLRPYDVVVDLRHTTAGLRHADVHPLAAWRSLPASVVNEVEAGRRVSLGDLNRVRWEYALDRSVDILGYAGLSILLAMGFDESVRRRLRRPDQGGGAAMNAAACSIGTAIRRCAGIGFVVASLGMMVTVIRIFLISHGLDTAHFACAVIGWLVGCAIAAAIGFPPPIAPARKRGAVSAGQKTAHPDGVPLPRGIIGFGLACGFVFPILYELAPFDFRSATRASGSLLRAFLEIPLGRHIMSRPNDAFYDLSGEFIRYGAVGLCIAVLFLMRPQWPWRRQLAAIIAVVAVLCAVLQVAQFHMQSRRADVTTIIVASVAAATAVIGLRWARDYRRHLAVVAVDDPLTRQLVEGRTYDKSSDAAQLERQRSGAGSSR